MAYSFKNSKGVTYFLHGKNNKTSTGKTTTLFFFSRIFNASIGSFSFALWLQHGENKRPHGAPSSSVGSDPFSITKWTAIPPERDPRRDRRTGYTLDMATLEMFPLRRTRQENETQELCSLPERE